MLITAFPNMYSQDQKSLNIGNSKKIVAESIPATFGVDWTLPIVGLTKHLGS